MGLLAAYHYYNYEIADSRTRDWSLIKEPFTASLISFVYLCIVLKWAPNFMKNRPPYALKTFVQLYNIFQVIANFMFVYALCKIGWITKIWFYCVLDTEENEHLSLPIANVMWWVTCIKFVEYIETIVFVLRKKQEQITFLHLYHHVSTAHICWVLVKYLPEKMGSTFVILNCAVHVLMYGYYFLSSCGDSCRVYVQKWKRRVTVIQLIQFLIMITYITYHFVTGCPTASTASLILGVDIVINLILFLNFYKKSYMKRKVK